MYKKIYFVHFNGFQCNNQLFSIAPTACGEIRRLNFPKRKLTDFDLLMYNADLEAQT
ncbi:hypothetical protein [Polaromonas sp. UBA4122]|uniref:hypothetical protein n=1 Tax=Polaromonas sp. UBA4122 TaxID=1947074 RepID=UPI0032E38910